MTLIRPKNFDVGSTFQIDEILISSPGRLCSLFPFYHFLTISALRTYSNLFWYNAESM